MAPISITYNLHLLWHPPDAPVTCTWNGPHHQHLSPSIMAPTFSTYTFHLSWHPPSAPLTSSCHGTHHQHLYHLYLPCTHLQHLSPAPVPLTPAISGSDREQLPPVNRNTPHAMGIDVEHSLLSESGYICNNTHQRHSQLTAAISLKALGSYCINLQAIKTMG